MVQNKVTVINQPIVQPAPTVVVLADPGDRTDHYYDGTDDYYDTTFAAEDGTGVDHPERLADIDGHADGAGGRGRFAGAAVVAAGAAATGSQKGEEEGDGGGGAGGAHRVQA